jgi:hypothetical protein
MDFGCSFSNGAIAPVFELLVDLVRFAPGFFRRKSPRQDSHVSRFASLLRCHGFTMYLGGAASDTPTY